MFSTAKGFWRYARIHSRGSSTGMSSSAFGWPLYRMSDAPGSASCIAAIVSPTSSCPRCRCNRTALGRRSDIRCSASSTLRAVTVSKPFSDSTSDNVLRNVASVSTSRMRHRAARLAVSSSSSEPRFTGFCTMRITPSRSASWSSSCAEYAVISSTLMPGARAFIALKVATPSMPGIFTSMSTTSNASVLTISTASMPEYAWLTSQPRRRRTSDNVLTMKRSSSTTRTRGFMSGS